MRSTRGVMAKALIVGSLLLGPAALAAAPPAPAGLAPILVQAEKGNVQDQLVLGELYQYGFGLPDHNVPALAWYLIAARAGDAHARSRASLLEHTMSKAEIARARARAARLGPITPVSNPTPPPPPTHAQP